MEYDQIAANIVAEIRDLKAENERQRAEIEALKYSLELDEELIGMIQRIIGVLNNRPVPNAALRGAEPASSAERPLEGTVMPRNEAENEHG